MVWSLSYSLNSTRMPKALSWVICAWLRRKGSRGSRNPCVTRNSCCAADSGKGRGIFLREGQPAGNAADAAQDHVRPQARVQRHQATLAEPEQQDVLGLYALRHEFAQQVADQFPAAMDAGDGRSHIRRRPR